MLLAAPKGIDSITECGSTLYLGNTVEFLNNWGFDHGIIQANKLHVQKPTTRLQIDLHGLAGHKNHRYNTQEQDWKLLFVTPISAGTLCCCWEGVSGQVGGSDDVLK